MLVLQILAFVVANIHKTNALNNVDTFQSKSPINIGVMAPITGDRAWWGRGIALAAEMAVQYINSRTDILHEFPLKLVTNDTKGETGLGNRILFDYVTNKKVLLVLGPARSNVALSVADTAKYWDLITVSASAETGDLSSSQKYPYNFRTIPSLSATSSTFVALAKRFGWTNVAILYFSRDMYIRAAEQLRIECEEKNITVLSFGSYLTDPLNQLKHIKAIDARVIFAFLQKATTVSCQIYNQGLHGPKYAWVINTPDQDGWWNRTFDTLNCSKEQVNQAVHLTILVKNMYISQSDQRTFSRLTPREFLALYTNYTSSRGVRLSEYGAFAFDAVWLIALSLNSSLEQLPLDTSLKLSSNENISRTIRENLLKYSFLGVSGKVKLQANGDRLGIFEIFQLRGSGPPADRTRVQFRLLQISKILFSVMCSASAIGTLLASGFLYFNIVNRKKRYIKMSSPSLNNAIIIGCILSYMSLIFFAMDGDRLTTSFCKAKVALLSVAFTVAFGAMFAKTWRVYRITRKVRPKRRVIRDVHLFIMIGGFLLVDTVILVTWSLLDPSMKDTKFTGIEEPDSHNEDLVYKRKVHYCHTSQQFFWYTLLYAYKAILLLFGLFLAWETRKVKICAINDSHYIGLAVYNVFLVCVIGVSVEMFLVDSNSYQLSFIILTICIFSSTTLTLCLVFLPKITGLKRITLLGDQKLVQPSMIQLYEQDFNGRPCSCKRKDQEMDQELTQLKLQLQKVQRERNQLLFRKNVLFSKTIYV